MKRLKGLAALLLSLALLAGCAAAPAKEEREEGAFVAHGYLRGGAGVAQLDGALYAFLPKGEGPGAREYLYELNEDGGKGRIVCGKAGCAHEEQGTLLGPLPRLQPHRHRAYGGGRGALCREPQRGGRRDAL